MHETIQQFKQIKTYSRTDCLQIMESVCKQYNIKLIFLTSKQGKGGFNYGACVDNEIMLSPFKGKNPVEREFISFFHEFAHLRLSEEIPFNVHGYVVNNSSQMQYEIWITMIGIKFAKERCDVIFSDDAVQWLLKQNFSYKNNECGEKCSLINYSKDNYTLDIFHLKKRKEGNNKNAAIVV